MQSTSRPRLLLSSDSWRRKASVRFSDSSWIISVFGWLSLFVCSVSRFSLFCCFFPPISHLEFRRWWNDITCVLLFESDGGERKPGERIWRRMRKKQAYWHSDPNKKRKAALTQIKRTRKRSGVMFCRPASSRAHVTLIQSLSFNFKSLVDFRNPHWVHWKSPALLFSSLLLVSPPFCLFFFLFLLLSFMSFLSFCLSFPLVITYEWCVEAITPLLRLPADQSVHLLVSSSAVTVGVFGEFRWRIRVLLFS